MWLWYIIFLILHFSLALLVLPIERLRKLGMLFNINKIIFLQFIFLKPLLNILHQVIRLGYFFRWVHISLSFLWLDWQLIMTSNINYFLVLLVIDPTIPFHCLRKEFLIVPIDFLDSRGLWDLPFPLVFLIFQYILIKLFSCSF